MGEQLHIWHTLDEKPVCGRYHELALKIVEDWRKSRIAPDILLQLSYDPESMEEVITYVVAYYDTVTNDYYYQESDFLVLRESINKWAYIRDLE